LLARLLLVVRRTPGMGRLLVVILEGVDLQARDANGRILGAGEVT